MIVATIVCLFAEDGLITTNISAIMLILSDENLTISWENNSNTTNFHIVVTSTASNMYEITTPQTLFTINIPGISSIWVNISSVCSKISSDFFIGKAYFSSY